MTYKQIDLYDAIEAEKAAQCGIAKAVDHAQACNYNWSEHTYSIFLTEFLPQHKRFLAEDFRSWLAVHRADYQFPPSKRAFGGIMRKAKDQYYIICIGTQKVTNVKAHGANASIWERNDERMIENGLM